MTPVPSRDAQVSSESAAPHLADRPAGPGAAMVVSAGLAIFVLGLLTLLAEVSEGVSAWLGTWAGDAGVGALAGKTTIASMVYVGSLALLWTIWRTKDVNLRSAFYVGLTLAVLGAVATFPPFFTMFAG